MAEKIVLAELDINVKNLDKSTTLGKKRINELKQSLKLLETQEKKNVKELVRLNVELQKINKSYQSNLNALSQLAEKEENKAKISKENLASISQLNAENKKLNRERDNSNAKLAKLIEKERKRKESLVVLDGSIKALRKSNRDLRKERDNLNVTTEDGQKKIAALNVKIDQNNKLIRENSDNLTKQKINIGNYASAWNAATGVISKAGAVLGVTFGIIQGFRMLFTDVTQRILAFNKVMTDIKAITNASNASLAVLNKTIISVAGSSIRTSVEVAELAKELIKLGFATEEVTVLLEAVNNFSIALGISSKESAEFLGSVVRAFDASAIEVDRFADVLSKATTRSSLDFEKLRDSLTFVAPVAKAVGQTIEGLTAQLSVLADNGIKASTSGRSLRQVYVRLAKEGITLEEALNDINTSQNKLTRSTELFGVESATVALVLASNIEKTADLNREYQNVAGTLDQLTKIQLESLTNKIAGLDSAWEKFVLSLEDGNGVLGKFVSNAILNITGLLNLITEATKSTDAKEQDARAKARIETAKAINEVALANVKNIEDESKRTEALIKRRKELVAINREGLNVRIEDTQKTIDLLKEEGVNLGDNAQILEETLGVTIEKNKDLINFREDFRIFDDTEIDKKFTLNELLEKAIVQQGRLKGEREGLNDIDAQIIQDRIKIQTITNETNKNLTDTIDSLSINSLLSFSEAVKNVSAEATESIIDINKQLNDEFDKSLNEAEKKRLDDLNKRFLDQENTMRESGVARLDIQLQQAINERDLLLEQDELTNEGRKSIQLDFQEFEREIAITKLQDDKNLLDAKIKLAKDLIGLTSALFGDSKEAAIASIVIERASSISEIISNTGIANAKAVATSPTTLGQPWVGLNTASAAIGIAGSIAGGVKAIGEINAVKKPTPTFATGGAITKLEGKSHAQGGEDITIGGRTVGNMQGGESFGIFKRSATDAIMDFNNSFPNDGGQQFRGAGIMQSGGVVNTSSSLNLNDVQRLVDASVNAFANNVIVAVPVNDVNDINQDITATATDGTI